MSAYGPQHNNAFGDTTKVDAEYREVTAGHDRSISGRSHGPELSTKLGGSMSRPAESPVDRTEEGIAALTDFAEDFWKRPGEIV